MTIPADLEAALAAADLAGVRLWAEGEAVKVRSGWAALPDDAREAMQRHKSVVRKILLANPRPDPDPVWFVRRNLAVYDLPAAATDPGQRWVWVGGKPYHRLTPTVLAYLDVALARALPHLAPDARAEAMARCGPLAGYVAAHFRPDQEVRAFASPPPTLPDPACPAPSV